MPIFEKDGERVYFAHIPKAAGSAVYLLFLRGGWRIFNVDSADRKQRIGRRIAAEFGITEIPQEGGRGSYRGALQHAPHAVWKTWGPFSSSFAISREPYDRFASAMRYVYTRHWQWRSFDSFQKRKLRVLDRQFRGDPVAVQNVFRPAHFLVAPDTRIFRYEEDWSADLCAAYRLEPGHLDAVNRTPPVRGAIGAEAGDFVRQHYAEDFRRFHYPIYAAQAAT